MAWSFELAVECGVDQAAAVAVKDHFNGVPFTLEDGTSGRWLVDYVTEDEDKRWWVSVFPIVGENAIEWNANPEVMAACGRKLYERLQSAHGYRFAVVGIETFQFNRAEALRDLLGHAALAGLVVSEGLFQELGRPSRFVKFSDGYYWIPSSGTYT